MTDKKEWIGITINEITLMGRIIDEPEIVETTNGNKCAFMNMKTVVNEQVANGQWVDTEIIVPLVVMDHRKVTNVVEKFVNAGRQLYVKAYYKSWPGNSGETIHGMIVRSLKLGSKPYIKPGESEV